MRVPLPDWVMPRARRFIPESGVLTKAAAAKETGIEVDSCASISVPITVLGVAELGTWKWACRHETRLARKCPQLYTSSSSPGMATALVAHHHDEVGQLHAQSGRLVSGAGDVGCGHVGADQLQHAALDVLIRHSRHVPVRHLPICVRGLFNTFRTECDQRVDCGASRCQCMCKALKNCCRMSTGHATARQLRLICGRPVWLFMFAAAGV